MLALTQKKWLKAYSLLVNILKTTKKVGIGKVVLRDREQMVALRAYQRGIVVHLLHYQDELRPMDEIKEITAMAGEKVRPDEKELQLGKMLVNELSSDRFDASEFSDLYTRELEKLIEAKAKGKEIITVPEASREQPTTDLLEALKASVKKVSDANNKGRK